MSHFVHLLQLLCCFCLQPNVLDEEQSAQQDRTSPVPTTSAGSALPDSVKAESDADMEVEKLQSEVVENTTVPPTGSENVKEESPPSSVTSADTKSVPAASAATMSVSEPVTFEENSSKLPPMTEDVFRAITSALRKHKLAKGGETKVEDKEVMLPVNLYNLDFFNVNLLLKSNSGFPLILER